MFFFLIIIYNETMFAYIKRSSFRLTNPYFKRIFKATLCSLRKAFVRKVDDESHISLSFVYSSSLKKENHFHFVSQQTEQLKVFCGKIAQSIKTQNEAWIKRVSVANVAATKIDLQNDFKDSDVAVYLDGNKIDDSVLNKWAFQTGAILKIGQIDFKIEVNFPSVIRIILPEDMMAGFHIYPHLELEFAKIEDSEITWYRSDRQEQPPDDTSWNRHKKHKAKKSVDLTRLKWEQVGEGFTYLSSFDDFNRYLKVKCIPIANGRRGDPLESVPSTLVQTGPGPSPFDKRHLYTQNITKAGSFRIVSYNILADCFINNTWTRDILYSSCPRYALAQNYRQHLQFKEIHGYNCDIICLQEVDIPLYFEFLLPRFTYLNYKGNFDRKGDVSQEGLAYFYNKKKFSLIHQQTIRIGEVLEKEAVCADILKKVSKNDLLKTNIFNRATIAQIVILKPLDMPDRKLCLVNTHLYADPMSRNIRLLQAGILLRYLEQIINTELINDPNNSVALVLAGDFNSLPGYGVYQLMTSQFIPEDHPEWTCVSDEAVDDISLSHSFPLISVYGTPPYTNYVQYFSGCLDYIFADISSLVVDEIVPLPSLEEVTEHTALPSITMPSDHLALVCTLKWI